MLTPRGPSRSLKSLHRNTSTSDVPIVTRGHTRVGIRTARCALRRLAPCGAWRGVDPRARGPCFALPVRARRAKARERLPSYRKPASRNPQAMHAETCRNPRARAPFRLLPIRAPRQWGYELLPG
jgi:hypothetical protein